MPNAPVSPPAGMENQKPIVSPPPPPTKVNSEEYALRFSMIVAYKPGTEVKIKGSHGITAHIDQVCIRYDLSFTYEVVWWSGRERRTEWLSADQFEVISSDTIQIGFKG